ncbi:hypothetical protein CPB86DRAFT_815762 [Serendipita vermifera]|nr:hypothetical protein CPB86DRAFT_815762 [Serendipita vermifera]
MDNPPRRPPPFPSSDGGVGDHPPPSPSPVPITTTVYITSNPTQGNFPPSPSPTLLPTLFKATATLMSDNINSTSTENGSNGAVEASVTLNAPVQVSNAFSLVACLLVFASYWFFRRKNRRIMARPSLVLAVSMASADALLHTINLFGYSDLPHNFICAFFGGFLYAFPTLISIFYSFCIALNTQLVFVFGKRPGDTTLKYYILIPIILSALICIPALSAGLYGYDAAYDLCWYATTGTYSSRLVTTYLLTFGLWMFVVMVYLIFAAVTIIYTVFSASSRMNKLASSLAKSMNSNGINPNGDATTGKFTNAATRPNLTINTGGGEGNNDGGATSADAIPIETKYVGSASMIGLKSEFESDEPYSPTTPGKTKRLTLFSNTNHHLNSSPHPNITINTSNFANTATGVRPLSTGQYGQSSGGSSHPRPFNFAGNSATLSRRSLAMRALAFRLLGYILIPTICILPGVIQDLFGKVDPVAGSHVPDAVSTLLDTLNGLVGLFNAILYAYDPALLALYQIMKNERRERRYFDAKEGDASPPRQNPNNQGDVEMGQVNTVYVTPPESPVEGEAPGFLGINNLLRGNHKQAHSNTSRSGRSNQHNGEPGSGPGSGTTTPGGGRVEKTELDNGTRVEVRTGKFLAPILVGSKTRKAERALPTPRNFIDMSSQHSLGFSGYASADDGGMSDTGNPMAGRIYYGPTSPGIMVQVDVQVRDDQDRDLERLERYLGGL